MHDEKIIAIYNKKRHEIPAIKITEKPATATSKAVPRSGCLAIRMTGITIKMQDKMILINLGGKNLSERYDESKIGTAIFINSDG